MHTGADCATRKIRGRGESADRSTSEAKETAAGHLLYSAWHCKSFAGGLNVHCLADAGSDGLRPR
jgi:hypothetical protein